MLQRGAASILLAQVVELVDTPRSGRGAFTGMRVQVPP